MLNCFKANDSFYDGKPFLSFIVEHLFVEPFASAIDYFENTAEFNNPNALASKALPLHCRLKNSALIQILSIITLFPLPDKRTAFGNQTFAWIRCFLARNTTAPSWWIIEHNEAQNSVQRIFFLRSFPSSKHSSKILFCSFSIANSKLLLRKKWTSRKKTQIVFNIRAPFELLWN